MLFLGSEIPPFFIKLAYFSTSSPPETLSHFLLLYHQLMTFIIGLVRLVDMATVRNSINVYFWMKKNFVELQSVEDF